jgi:hypothetical protein
MEEIHVETSTQIAELRKQIANELIRIGKLPSSCSPNYIRLRDRYALNPGKILRDGKTINENQIFLCDHKTISVQILDHEEDLPSNETGDVIVFLQRWQRSTWSLRERIEMLLPGSYTVRDVAKGLASFYQIPFPNIKVLVVPKENSFYLSDLNQHAPKGNYGRMWFDPKYERKLMRYMSHDMRVQDGDLIIIQDCEEPLKELTPADLKSIEIVTTANSTSSYYGGSNYYSSNYYGYNSYAGGASTSTSAISTNTVDWSTPYDAVSKSISAKGKSLGGSTGNTGIKIKTHKERLKEQSLESSQNTSSEVLSPTAAFEGTPDLMNTNEEDELKLLQKIDENIQDINTESAYQSTYPNYLRNNSPTTAAEGIYEDYSAFID